MEENDLSIVIFLNGCGSAGKTSIARSIQHLSTKPWLRIGIDMLIDMLPEKYIAIGEKAKEGYFAFITNQNQQKPQISIENGPLGKNFFKLAPNIAAVFANQNHQLIIDEVLFDNEIIKLYVEHLKQHKVYFIGVRCNLETMQEREVLRRDRMIGLAYGQMDRVHAGVREYDFIVDTTQTSAFKVAESILAFIEANPYPNGFKKMERFFNENNL